MSTASLPHRIPVTPFNRPNRLGGAGLVLSILLLAVLSWFVLLLPVLTCLRIDRGGPPSPIATDAGMADPLPLPSGVASDPIPTPHPDLASVPSASDAWWLAVQAGLEHEEYAARPADDGLLQAPNRAQDFRVRFRPAEIEVVPRASEGEAAWRFAWRTSRFGRAGAMRAVDSPTRPETEGSRVLYRHTRGLVEWYENRPAGLEQGFTLAERPAGDGTLAVEGTLPDRLRAELDAEGAVDLFDAESGSCVLHYGEPHVFDAQDRELPSWLALDGDRLSIVVADAGAAYPVTIDPLISSPAWFGEPDQSEASYGAAVATAGDVNGDGYSDILVGAPYYDNGQENEGKVWLYLGSASGPANAPAWTSEANQADAGWGMSVGSAGDVNRDGFADVIVGSVYYDNDQVDEGRAMVFLGSAAGLAAAPAWTVESNQASAQLGQVATAGDVNGDGFADVVVGAPSYDNGTGVGRAFAYLGSAQGLSTTASWIAETNQPSIFGFSLGTAGDVNADGFSDVIVGAFFYQNGEAQEGRAFVYHGSAGGLQTSAAWTAESNQGSARFAYSVGTAGDVNGDGYADVVVGAPHYDNGQSDEGRAFVYLGSAVGLQAAAAWTAESNQGSAELGFSVATAGDVNGDGYADVLAGAHLYNNAQPDVGRVFLYEGSATGLSNSIAWFGESATFGSDYGGAVAPAGDVNGDGYSDILIGSRYFTNVQFQEGRAFVYNGTPVGPTTTADWLLDGAQPAIGLGESIASAGDVNGDGYSDVIVGAPYFDNGQTNEGRAFVFHGSATGVPQTPAWTGESNQAESWYGISVAGAGDVNGDGYSDVIVSALFYDNELDGEGRVFVYHGSPSGLGLTPAWTAESNQSFSYYGRCVATAGDVNGDGYSDVIVGAINYDDDWLDEGRVFVYHGSATGLAPTPSWFVDSNQTNAHFGFAVASAGDVNADGYSDVIIGSYTFDNPQSNEGRAYVYLGSASGLAPAPVWMAEGNQADAFFGRSVASAGDMNGDGFSDIVVSALYYDNDQVDEGRVFVYAGTPSGPTLSPSWTTESNQTFCSYGEQVASAGDVNGDGFSDVLIGAPLYSNPQTRVGRATVHLGSAAGLAASPAWFTDSDQSFSDYAYSVASAGDVNGDGFSDLLVGAKVYAQGQQSFGRAYLYMGNGGDGADRIPRQAQVNGASPIALLGASDSNAGFRLKALGRSAAGRGRVAIQAEAKPLGVPFDGQGLVTSTFTDTGAPGPAGSAVPLAQLVGNLAPETVYHWRLRLVTDAPHSPRSPWLSPPGNAPSEADVRTAATTTGVGDLPSSPARLAHIEANTPNPFTASTELAYTLTRDARLRLAVYDVTGRQVALLADQAQVAGRHTQRWEARDSRGRALPAGVYFVRLEVGGEITSRKVVVAR